MNIDNPTKCKKHKFSEWVNIGPCEEKCVCQTCGYTVTQYVHSWTSKGGNYIYVGQDMKKYEGTIECRVCGEQQTGSWGEWEADYPGG